MRTATYPFLKKDEKTLINFKTKKCKSYQINKKHFMP